MKARFILLALSLTAFAREAYAQKPKLATYIVQEGETCESVAKKLYGNKKLAKLLYLYNYFPTPSHELKTGQKLFVLEEQPDAKLTRQEGEVQARPPTENDWQSTRPGMELSRAWQVVTQAQSGAEITLNDGALIYLREATTFVINGSGELATLLHAAQTELLRGTIKTRPTESNKLSVMTPSAKIKLGAGSAMLNVAADGATRVSNYEGASIRVTGRIPGEKSAMSFVALEAGMGLKVAPNQEPGEPRPLPPTPAWSGIAVSTVLAVDHTGDLHVAWTQVTQAESYALEVSRDAQGEEVLLRMTAPREDTALALKALPVGVYYVSVSSVDAEGFESRASERVAFSIIEPAFCDQDGAKISRNQLAVGSHFTAPDGYKCTAKELDLPKSRLSFNEAGRFTIHCADELGISLAPLPIDVSEVRVSVAGLSSAQEPLRRGQPTQIAFKFSSAVGSLRLQQDIYAEFGPIHQQEDGTWQTTITVKEHAPAKLTVRFLTGPERAPLMLGEVLFPVEATPVAPQARPEEPTETSRAKLKLGLGLLGGTSLHKAAALDGASPSPLFTGLRLSLDAAFASLEAEVKSSLPADGADNDINAGVQAKLAFSSGGVYPFFVAGVGLELAGSNEPAAFFYPGLGLEYRGERGLGLRLDLRGIFMPQGAPENLFGESSIGLFLRR